MTDTRWTDRFWEWWLPVALLVCGYGLILTGGALGVGWALGWWGA